MRESPKESSDIPPFAFRAPGGFLQKSSLPDPLLRSMYRKNQRFGQESMTTGRYDQRLIFSITYFSTQYNKKPPVLRIPGAFCLVLGECLIPGFDHVELRCPAFGLEGVCALGLHDALLRFPSVGGDFCCYFSQIL